MLQCEQASVSYNGNLKMRGCTDKLCLGRGGLRESLSPQIFQEKRDSSHLTLSTYVSDMQFWLCRHPLELKEIHISTVWLIAPFLTSTLDSAIWNFFSSYKMGLDIKFRSRYWDKEYLKLNKVVSLQQCAYQPRYNLNKYMWAAGGKLCKRKHRINLCVCCEDATDVAVQ